MSNLNDLVDVLISDLTSNFRYTFFSEEVDLRIGFLRFIFHLNSGGLRGEREETEGRIMVVATLFQGSQAEFRCAFCPASASKYLDALCHELESHICCSDCSGCTCVLADFVSHYKSYHGDRGAARASALPTKSPYSSNATVLKRPAASKRVERPPPVPVRPAVPRLVSWRNEHVTVTSNEHQPLSITTAGRVTFVSFLSNPGRPSQEVSSAASVPVSRTEHARLSPVPGSLTEAPRVSVKVEGEFNELIRLNRC